MLCPHVQRSPFTSPLLPSQGAKIFLKITKEIAVTFVTNAVGYDMEPAKRSPHEFCPLFLAGGITICSASLRSLKCDSQRSCQSSGRREIAPTVKCAQILVCHMRNTIEMAPQQEKLGVCPVKLPQGLRCWERTKAGGQVRERSTFELFSLLPPFSPS